MAKAGLFYHNMRQLLKNKNMYIIVSYSLSPIPQVEEQKKWYTVFDVNIANRESQFQNITGQPVNQILHAVDNKILKTSQFSEKMAVWLSTYMDPVCHIFRGGIPPQDSECGTYYGTKCA